MTERNMSNIDEAKKAIDLIAALTERALAVVESAPYWSTVYCEEWAKLEIDGETATLASFHLTLEYDSPVIEETSTEFPASLLFISDKELRAWKAEAKLTYEKKQRQFERTRQEIHKAAELTTLAALKAKYER